MTDKPPPGFPSGYVPIVGDVVGDGEVRPPQGGNRMFSGEEMEKAFGPRKHVEFKMNPNAGKRRRGWMKKG